MGKIIMKYVIAIVFFTGLVYGGSMYGSTPSITSGSSDYGGDSYADNSGQKCYPTYETKYKKQCESYDEKVCYTTHLEACEPVVGKKCKAIQTSKQERKCFDVNELLCSLKENVQYEEIPAVFTVQKCHKMKERVCDTVYETELTEKDDYKCITVVNPYCAKKDRTVYEPEYKCHKSHETKCYT